MEATVNSCNLYYIKNSVTVRDHEAVNNILLVIKK